MSAQSIYEKAPFPIQTLLLNAAAAKVWGHRYGPRFQRELVAALKRDSWEVKEIQAYRDARIRLVVSYAYDHSPFYREMMDKARVQPSDIRCAEDLTRLPLLEKDVLRERLGDVLTARRPRRGWLHGHTSGTTGSPLSLWYDRNTAIMNNAMDRRQKVWGGVSTGDWVGLFLGHTIVARDRDVPPFWHPDFLQRQVWFSSFHLTAENVPLYMEEIDRRRLKFLEGYPSTLFILAQYVLDAGARLPLKAVFVSSESFHRIQRETIEEAFQCQIFDFFGHAERVIFASECEAHAGKHLAEDYGYTEIVDARGSPLPIGEMGYLVGTSLFNLAMPMIRYRTDDISMIIDEPCSCGRPYRRIADVTTKAEDIVVTPDGRLLSPSILTHPFKPFTEIRKSQIIQESIDKLVVRIVLVDALDALREAELLAALQRRVGEGMEVSIERVDSIPSEGSGKYRWVISKVDHKIQLSWDE